MTLTSFFSAAVRSRTRMSAMLPVPVLVVAMLLILYFSGAIDAITGNAMTCSNKQTRVIRQTTHLHRLTIVRGCTLMAPARDSLTLTVNGVETGQVLTATGGAVTRSIPGTYRGDVVLTVAQANLVPWQGLTFPFRQGLYVDSNGVVNARSVLASVVGGQVSNTEAKNIKIISTGQAFNGVYVTNSDYMLEKPIIALTGDGRCDFVGYGAAIVGNGTKTRLVGDGANISNQGAVRTGIIADNGANLIVKNSTIQVRDGVLPADYQPTVDLAYMEAAPWMLSIGGNVRATNLLGVNTKATYINSSISSEGWGALSTDSGQNGQLTAIDSNVANTGQEGGYGSYAIGNATERFLGDHFNVATYATINRGGTVYYGDSTHAAVALLDTELGLGLTAAEIAALPVRPTIINSQRFGVMWHGAGSVNVSGGTIVNSKESTFLDKGQQIAISVDGSQGAQLHPGNGIILQMMENDDPGPVMVGGKVVNQGIYHDPTSQPGRVPGFDVSAVHSTDAIATFSNITLNGNFYNGMRGGSAANGATAGGGGQAAVSGENMVLTFNNSRINGVISATQTHHSISTITSAQYKQLGEVTNRAHPVINNGVIVNLNSGSRWTVTGTSYLSKLAVAANAAIAAPGGHSVVMTINGVPTTITPGKIYTGSIALVVH
jgi:hypothetical protein